jgi:Flp pilus assembly protein TadD/TolB-like protein
VLTGIIISIILAFPFENSTNDRNLDWIGEGITELIVERLRPEAGLAVYTRDERLAGFEKAGIPETTVVSRATALKLGWEAGADHLVVGRFSGTPDNFQITARIVDLETSASSPEFRMSGKLEDIIAMVDSLSWQLLKAIHPGSARSESDFMARPPLPQSAFENYVRGIMSTDPQKRAAYLQTAIRLHPQYEAAMFQLGRSFYEDRDFKNSSLWLEKIPGTSPDYLQAQFLTGLNRYHLGDGAGAAAVFEKLPQTYDVQINLAAAYLLRGDHVSALLTWRKAMELDPLSSDAFFNSGYLSYLQNQNEAAVRDLRESLKLRGRDSEALFLLGRALERLGQSEEARRVTAQATRLSQRVERWLTQPLPKLERLRASTSFRNRSAIWTDKRAARRAKGQDLASWLEEVQTLVDAYQYGEAIRELQEVMRTYPGAAEARSLLDEVQARQRAAPR